MAAATAAGVQVFRLDDVDLGWLGPARFDYSALDGRLSALANAATESSFVLRVRVDAPRWWLDSHPADCVGYLGAQARSGEKSVSWASTTWRGEAGAALARLVRHIESGPHARRSIGWQIAAGRDGGWRYQNAEDQPDVSAAMTAYFRKWTADKYRHNTGLLRKAWFDARAEFNELSCPGAAERLRADIGILRNPQRSMRMLDYYACLADAQNSAALSFCAQARRAAGGAAIVGLAFAGLDGLAPAPEDGHGQPEPVLDAEEVGFLVSAGVAGAGWVPTFSGSVALREKLLIVQARGAGDALRATAAALTHQCGVAMPAETDPEALRQALASIDRAMTLSARTRRRASPVAVVADMSNRRYVAEPDRQALPINSALFSAQMDELAQMGAPFDLYLLSDLFHPRFPEYKIVLFVNCYYLSEAERRRVDARAKRSGTTVLWLWGAGLIGEEGVNGEYATRLTGQKTRVERGAISLRVRITEGNDPLTWGQHPGTQIGPDRPIGPVVTIADKKTIRLGANTDNKTVFAVMRAADWSSVVTGQAFLSAGSLRSALRATGAHLFAGDGVSVFADSRSVAVTSPRAGAVALSLPGRYDVVDGWTGRTVGQGLSEMTLDLKANETAYLELTKRSAESGERRPEPRNGRSTKQ